MKGLARGWTLHRSPEFRVAARHRGPAVPQAGLAVLGAALLTGLAGMAGAQESEPFRVRNLNPLVAIFGLPAWESVRSGRTLGLTTEWANHYRIARRGTDSLVLDGETRRTTLFFTSGFGDAWSFGVDVPYYKQSGGWLDGLIEGWHSAFSLPSGGRGRRPEDQLLFELADADGTFFTLDAPGSGLGDVQVKLARRVGDGFVVQGNVKLPTGDEDILAGSGSADWALTLLRPRAVEWRSRPAGYFWGVGVLRLGRPDLVAFDSRTPGYTAVLGGSWQPWPRIGLKAQLDFHSALYDTPLREIGRNATLGTLGGWLRLKERAELEFGVVEDFAVGTSPDVVLQVAVRWVL